MEKQLESLAQKALAELEYDDCFIIEIKSNNGKVEVYLDSDDTVTFEKCRKVSRLMEEVLDEEKWFGEKYTLEVSSAGIGRPLKYGRQYIKNIGRTIEIKLSQDGGTVKGTITKADNEKCTVEVTKKIKEGKKKKTVTEEIVIAYEDIKESKIKVSF